MRLLSIGEKRLYHEEEVLAKVVAGALKSLQPRMVMSDLSNGWGLIVAEQAQALGINTMAVFPHEEVLGNRAYQLSRDKVLKKINTSVVFEKTYLDYLKNPSRHLTWILSNSDEALCYVNPEVSSLSHSLMVVFGERGKTIHNMFRRIR
jgi:hypothetical protein